jgi:hypothetical protein
MNHQVEHDIYVERACSEFADAVNLEVERSLDVRAQGCERRIETLKMAYLQQRATSARGSDHPVCFFERASDGFFDEDMYARFEQRTGNLRVGFSRHGQTDSIATTHKLAPVQSPFCLSFGGDASRASFVQIANGNELSMAFGGERGVNARVLATQMSDAYNGCA